MSLYQFHLTFAQGGENILLFSDFCLLFLQIVFITIFYGDVVLWWLAWIQAPPIFFCKERFDNIEKAFALNGNQWEDNTFSSGYTPWSGNCRSDEPWQPSHTWWRRTRMTLLFLLTCAKDIIPPKRCKTSSTCVLQWGRSGELHRKRSLKLTCMWLYVFGLEKVGMQWKAVEVGRDCNCDRKTNRFVRNGLECRNNGRALDCYQIASDGWRDSIRFFRPYFLAGVLSPVPSVPQIPFPKFLKIPGSTPFSPLNFLGAYGSISHIILPEVTPSPIVHPATRQKFIAVAVYISEVVSTAMTSHLQLAAAETSGKEHFKRLQSLGSQEVEGLHQQISMLQGYIENGITRRRLPVLL